MSITIVILGPLVFLGGITLFSIWHFRTLRSLERNPLTMGLTLALRGTLIFAICLLYLILQVRSSTGALWFLVVPLYVSVAFCVLFAFGWSFSVLALFIKHGSRPAITLQEVTLFALTLAVLIALLFNYGYSKYLVRMAKDLIITPQEQGTHETPRLHIAWGMS